MSPELKYQIVSVLVLLVPIAAIACFGALLWLLSTHVVDAYNQRVASEAAQRSRDAAWRRLMDAATLDTNDDQRAAA